MDVAPGGRSDALASLFTYYLGRQRKQYLLWRFARFHLLMLPGEQGRRHPGVMCHQGEREAFASAAQVD